MKASAQYVLSQDISMSLLQTSVCSNKNRIGILYLLQATDGTGLRAEEIANRLGITHRTALYHLNLLNDCGLVEVRRFKKKGACVCRSVWGISRKNNDVVGHLFAKIGDVYTKEDLDGIVSKNIARR